MMTGAIILLMLVLSLFGLSILFEVWFYEGEQHY
ncbi:hypothetical protein STA3757_06120 [Stanieria sp. NIES-3757]|nr:hypothetical protein STA3757_06120 [Stanieria sp. NIES-3757]